MQQQTFCSIQHIGLCIRQVTRLTVCTAEICQTADQVYCSMQHRDLYVRQLTRPTVLCSEEICVSDRWTGLLFYAGQGSLSHGWPGLLMYATQRSVYIRQLTYCSVHYRGLSDGWPTGLLLYATQGSLFRQLTKPTVICNGDLCQTADKTLHRSVSDN